MNHRLSNRTGAEVAAQTMAHALRGIQEAIEPDNNTVRCRKRDAASPGIACLHSMGDDDKKHAGRLFCPSRPRQLCRLRSVQQELPGGMNRSGAVR